MYHAVVATRAASRASPVAPRSTVARVRRFALEHDLLHRGDRVLVAVSGGPDSTCLLLVLAALRRSLALELHAAHFDHGLRGARIAQRELSFVRSLCDALDVPLHTGAGDVRARSRTRKQSIEEAARELRYRFLANVARRTRCHAVAAGHTRDDQAETVLLRLIRGSGLRGLAAMAPSAPWPVASRAATPRLVRPLLVLSRDDTVRCCRDAGVAPIEDASNRSDAHLRNRVRAELLPVLRRYNPRIDDALVRLADAASSDVELLEQLAADAVETMAGGVRVRRRVLAALPPALQRHAVRAAYERVAGGAGGLSDRNVLAVLRAAAGPTGSRLDLPRGVRVDIARDAVAFARGGKAAPAALPSRVAALPVPGEARLGRWRIEASLLARRPRNLSCADGNVAYLDAAAAGDTLRVRRRRPGDRFHPLGLAGPKKLQDYLVDAHVPRSQRDALPVVCSEGGIVWIAGQRPAEWAKITPRTKRLLRLRATRTRA
jgi:tRNA(Ile)-lysidine synthase